MANLLLENNGSKAGLKKAVQNKSVSSHRIPLSIPVIEGNEWRYVKECLDTGWVSSAGRYLERFENKIREFTGASFAVSCASGTAALHMALKIAGVNADEEVIVPTVTFIASVNAVAYLRAYPVFMDCDDYYNIEADKTIDFIEEETKFKKGFSYNRKTNRKVSAFLPVHVYGNAADLEKLIDLCRRRNIKVIEDATESLGTVYTSGIYANRHTGTIGDVGVLSFNGNKIITTGGGGMILTNNASYAQKARYLINQAKDDSANYIHNEIGYNFRLSNIQAALGLAQLERLEEIISIKKANYEIYRQTINEVEGLHLANTPPYADSNHWMYILQVDKNRYGRTKEELIKLFAKESIEVRPLWYLNHLQKPYRHCQSYEIERAHKMLDVTLNVPCSANLKKADILKIVGLLRKWKR